MKKTTSKTKCKELRGLSTLLVLSGSLLLNNTMKVLTTQEQMKGT